jgi:hypothetical protein
LRDQVQHFRRQLELCHDSPVEWMSL